MIRSLSLLPLLLGIVASAAAQPAVLNEIADRYQQCTAAGFVLEPEQAMRLQRSIDIWKLNPTDLAEAPRRQLLTLHVYAALGQGNATAARTAWDGLRAAFPDDAATNRLGYVVASATGDAPLAEETLRDLSRQLDRAERKSLSRPRRAARQIGQEAPNVRIRTSDLAEHNPSRPGDGCLVLHFWRRGEVAELPAEPMRQFAQRFAEDNVRLIGINADAEEEFDQAVAFAKERGYTWAQRYEGVARDAPLTDEAFRVPSPGWLVVIDSYGYVRAVGDPDDAAVSYAAQAASAEAADAFPRVLPTARDGSQPRVRSTASVETGKPSGGGSGDDLRDDREAETKLRRARLMLRTGQRNDAKALLREIVSSAPGTIQARKASEILDGLP